MQKRKLKLNENKTEIILIRVSSRGICAEDFGSLNVDGTNLQPTECVRDLGVHFGSSLIFKGHINSLVRSCHYHTRNLYAIKDFLDRQSLLTLVHSLILSRVDYCNSLYIGLPNYLLRKLQSVLNRAARLIFSLPPRVPTTPFLMELHWLPVKARIEFKLCLITYKAVNFGEPGYLAALLSPLTTGSEIALRSSDDPYRLEEPRAVQERLYACRSFYYTAPRVYNRLPVQIKQLASLDSFSNHLKTFFLRVYDVSDGTITEEYRI